ncbi:MAG: DNA repair protein RecN, partial [Candidatus Eremiobacteraeota bacterium]|nr:DNA repair protein RecN [Candidatus Eremiobacteraeota bacterium]
DALGRIDQGEAPVGMLRSLLIENYGLIERAHIELASGPTIFTGETGSGKTMVLGAVAFVLGERAGGDIVRRSAKRATVTLTFEPVPGLRQRLADEGFELDPDEDAVLAREMTEGGKSTIRLNGRQTTAGYVRDIAGSVADIIGQHEAQRLLAGHYHAEVLDRFGGGPLLTARDRAGVSYDAYLHASGELRALIDDESKAQAQVEFAQFASDEILGARLEIGEEERLGERRAYLDNIDKITSALKSAHEALTADQGATDSLGTACVAVGAVGQIDRALGSMAQTAAALQEQAGELATRIARALEETEFDSGELEIVNGRLDVLDRLKRKYGGTIQSTIAAGERYRLVVESFATRDERRVHLERQKANAKAELHKAAGALTALRTAAAKKLRARVESELPELALAAAKFTVALTPLPQILREGAESVEFTFTANAGEPLRPLAKVASGGELSRVLLALIVAVMDTREPAALIFDEIDAGVGGATATAVATRLARLGALTQVACVTHLAQIASRAERHYILDKSENRGTTTIVVREASSHGERAAELARMLSGQTEGVALKHAQELLEAARSAPA